MSRGLARVPLRGIPRLLWATRRLALGDRPALFCVGPTAQLFLDPNDYFQCQMYYQRYDPHLVRWARHRLRPGNVAIDVGAQLGYFSTLFADLVGPGGRVLAIEPDPGVRARLEVAIEASGLRQVSVIAAAAGEARHAGVLHVSPVAGWSTMAAGTHLSGTEATAVTVESVDHLAAAAGVDLPAIRLVKIDVEGYEIEVLRGMKATLAMARPHVCCELDKPLLACNGHAPSDLLEILWSFGYRVLAVRYGASGWLLRTRALRLSIGEVPPWEHCDLICEPSRSGRDR